MARKTNTPDNLNKNLSFWCEPVGEMPDVVFAKGKAMSKFWNLLVEHHQAFLEKHEGKQGKDRAEAYKAEWYATVRRLYNTEAKQLGLNSDETNHVTDAFGKAVAAAYDPKRPESKMPRFKSGLQSVHVPFCDRNGGRDVTWFFEKAERRIYVRPLKLGEATARRDKDRSPARAHFTVDGQAVALKCNLSQSFPTGTLVKRVSLIGSLQRPFGWQWRLQFTVSYPAPEKPVTGRAAIGLDLGWRRFEDRIRVGMIFDGVRYHEISLPLDMASRRTTKAGKRVDIRDAWELEAQIGNGVEQCKAALRAMSKSEWPEPARAMMQGIVKMRERGLFRLRRELREAGIEVPELEQWAAEYQKLFKKSRHLDLQIKATRTHFYRNLAFALASSCSVIAWEGDLNLKQLSETGTKKKEVRKKLIAEGVAAERSVADRIEESAQKWRAFVCLSDFRRFLREAVQKTNCQLVDRPAAWSTQVCPECGAMCESSPDLFLICANGHRRDQDKGSARLFRGELPEDTRASATPLDLSAFPDQAIRASWLLSSSVDL